MNVKSLAVAVAAVLAVCGCSQSARKKEPEKPKARKGVQAPAKPVYGPPPAPEPPAVRVPAVAGAFYPGTRIELRTTLDVYLEAAPSPKVAGRVGAMVSPHAGYVYSGPTAARAYKALKGRTYDAVVVVAPSHRAAFRGFSVWWKGVYRTPLGDVPVDEGLARSILAASRSGGFTLAGHVQEHSLEVQVPFLQRVLGSFRIVPIVMGEQSRQVGDELASVLTKVCRGKNILLVASTDLSHFHSLEEAKRLDGHLVDAIAAGSAERFVDCIESRKAEACGQGPTYVVLKAARALGYGTPTVTGYDTSATASGDTKRVVGYVSALFTGTGKAGSMTSKNASTEIFSLSDDEKIVLLRLVRQTISARVAGKDLPPTEATTDKLGEKSGAFVTLKIGGHLRGCIGYIVAVKPLVETIQDMALSAAFKDPRFGPVRAEEVEKLEIEISVLSPFEKIDDPTIIEVGRHGIQLSRGWNSGLLLPQVATEYGWDRETFLEHTCQKAGLPSGAWKDDDTEVKIFSAEIFNEQELGLGPNGTGK